MSKSFQEQQTLKTKGHLHWRELSGHLGSTCKDFNELNKAARSTRRLMFISQGEGFTLSYPDRRSIMFGRYIGDTIHVFGDNGVRYDSKFSFRVTADGLDALLIDDDGSPRDLETLAHDLIDCLQSYADSE